MPSKIESLLSGSVGNHHARLCHQNEQPHSLEGNSFAACVGAGDDNKIVVIQVNVNRDDGLNFQKGMTRAAQVNESSRGEQTLAFLCRHSQYPASRFLYPVSRFLYPVSRFLYPVSRFLVSCVPFPVS